MRTRIAKNQNYNRSDAWLLPAIIYAGGAATLERIIGAGDWINHAVFNPDELESGLARLAAGGLIKEKKKIFSATLKVRRAYAKTASPRRAVDKELSDIRQFIGAASTGEQPQLNDLKYDGITPEEFREAFDKYLKL